MGLFDELLARLSPDAKKRLAKEAAKSAVRGVGDVVYDRVDRIREDFEDAAEARREAQAREQAARERVAQAQRDEDAIDAELAALKRALNDEGRGGGDL